MYKVLGSDGNEYESLSAEKIKQWILENRVEKKTPVMPEGAADWVFLGELPEFAPLFADQEKKAGVRPGRKRFWQMVVVLILLAGAAAFGALLLLQKIRHH